MPDLFKSVQRPIPLLLLYGILCFCSSQSHAQPGAFHFNREIYRAGAQNWGFQQDTKGVLYIANNEGLLTFNGAFWHVHPLPNHTILRSIAFGEGNERLYAGGQDEIGYFSSDEGGRLQYQSLTTLIEKPYRQFADIWHITPLGNEVFFQSFSAIFRLRHEKITVYPSRSSWDFMGKAAGRLLAYERNTGLLEYQNGRWDTVILAATLPANFSITAIAPFRNNLLVATARHGLFALTEKQLTPLAANPGIPQGAHFTCAEVLANGTIALGTYDDGVIIMDSSGKVQNSYAAADGLPNNNIKAIFRERNNQLWLGLEDGLSFLDLDHPVKMFSPPLFNRGAGYAVTVSGGSIFFALASGLFEMPVTQFARGRQNEAAIKKLAGGLTWNVMEQKGRIFAGRDDGLYVYEGNRLLPLDTRTGYWNVRSLPAGSGLPAFAAGNYTGISFFSQKEGSTRWEGTVPGFGTSARFLEYDSLQKALWVSHPYRGLYKIDLRSRKTRYYTEKEGLPSTLNNHLFYIAQKPMVATPGGLFTYNAAADKFEPATAFANAFSGLSLRYLKADNRNNIWFISEKKPGVLDAKTGNVYFFPELQRKILSGFEHIYPLDQNHIVIGGEQGFFVLDYANYLAQKNAPEVHIRAVRGREAHDSLLFGGFGPGQNAGQPIRLSHRWHEISFDFAAPWSAQSPHLEYSYRLKGLDDRWSDWNTITQKSYAELQPGKYIFEVKVRNNLRAESPAAGFAFEVLPPWYKSIWAKAGYLLLLAAGIYGALKWQEKVMKIRHRNKLEAEKQKYEAQQKLQAYQHQLAIEQSERELMRLRNEKLESELAATAMNLVQKKEFLGKLREEISKLKNTGSTHIESQELKKVLKDLTAEDRLDEEWEQFSRHFNNVHNNFLVTLKEKFPQLTGHDLKLCAYLRMNLSSKEIARLMSISIRGVEINRYRLRKKLPLETKESLFEFLLNVEKSAGESK